jgi:sigma-B regulation protein RsbU (phosphoserine phosphatase)
MDAPKDIVASAARSLSRTIAALTRGENEQQHFELAAQRIQHALLDVVIPSIDGFDLGVCAEPARLVGGDYIDVYRTSSRSLVFGLGDASGKSLAAALNSLMLRYLVRGLVKALDTADLAAIVTHANDVLYEDMADDDFITFLLGSVDLDSGHLRVVNAGHEPPLILAADATDSITLNIHDIVLGISDRARYDEEAYQLEPGDTAVFYTDGLTEATDTHGEMFTINGLKRELALFRHLGAQDLATAMFEAVKKYTVAPLRDDSTIFVLRRI